MLSRLYKSINRLKIITPVITEGVGYAKSAQRIQKELGKDKVDLIDLNRKGSFKKILICFLSRNIIINGYSALGYYQLIMIIVFNNQTNIYIHEGVSQILKIERKWAPLKRKYVRLILKKAKVFCVSYNQRQQLINQSILTKKSDVIYNCAATKSSALINCQSKSVKILMAGTLQDSKGFKLYSDVSDFISSSDSINGFDFYWAGNRGNEFADLSNSVKFLGYVEDMSDLLRNIDIFFLSSKEEPFGLAALEALQEGKKLVCYKDSGIAELFGCINGVEIYSEYSMSSAIDALIRVQKVDLDKEKVEKVFIERLSINSFIKNIKNKIGFPND